MAQILVQSQIVSIAEWVLSREHENACSLRIPLIKQQAANHKTMKRRCCLLAYNDDGTYGTVQPRRW
jgi:hypothetical protein